MINNTLLTTMIALSMSLMVFSMHTEVNHFFITSLLAGLCFANALLNWK